VGQPPAEAVVNQFGGINEEGNVNLLKGDAVLKSGQTVMFATLFDAKTGWYDVLGGPYCVVRVKGDQRADINAIVKRFTEAERTQIQPNRNLKLFPGDEPDYDDK